MSKGKLTVLFALLIILILSSCALSPLINKTDKEAGDIVGHILLDESDIVITMTAIDYDGFLGPELKIHVENGKDELVLIKIANCHVNGKPVDTIFSESINSGKEAISSIKLMQQSLKNNNTDEIKSIELRFIVYSKEGKRRIFESGKIKVPL